MENLLYLYALVPASELEDTELPSLTGFDKKGSLYTVPIDDNITSIVCDLDGDEYSESVIENKIDNDMEWLQEKAFHHHETIETLYQNYTLIPLKFCTIYKTKDSLKSTIQDVEEKINATFDFLQDKEEWTLKLYTDDNKLKKEISKHNKNVEEKRRELDGMSKGKRFFAEKKIDTFVDTELENEKDRVGEALHQKIKALAVDYSIKKNWGRDVTGLKEEMVYNSVYLLPKDKVDAFLEIIDNEKNELPEEGWRIEATGPWPAYHFSSFN
ncbi:GvpL/GvpF family gas vesicle protein [Staphylococcus sp. EZ-P03]|uniref:GvpL/GvpF family gas vesicle protein n=1 Tax=Staphylococcus sp. EZ-P03 TaxID=2282739 RepID=UPI000DF74717|nr:GvpL/GvpF family gas vesicle protein [Staphylococcus sp. EZ-P03]